MDNIYQKIELQFSNDISDTESKFYEEKDTVEAIMKDHLIDYALEVIENKEKSFFESAYSNGYTLYLIVKKIDLNYIVKLLDENKIGYFLKEEDKWNAVEENTVQYEEDEVYEEQEEKEIEENERTEAEIEFANAYVRVFFTFIFVLLSGSGAWLAYFCYQNKKYEYLLIVIAFLILQIPVYKFFMKFFKKKDNHL